MKTKSSSAKQPCAVCGGQLRDTTITHEERRGSELYLFQNVPAQICTACGEVWIEEAVLEQIERLIKEGKPTREIATPVYDLAVAGTE
jgi:YgiT-type zinc finger domain-containing protein